MRLKLKDLQPGTNYSIQLRAVSNTAVSEWSRKFSFTTISDSRKPSMPTGVTWITVGNSFHGQWNSVTTTEAGTPAFVVRYEVELTAGATKRVKSVAQESEGEKVNFYLTFDENKALFGGTARPAISMRVRAVDGKGKFSAWTTPILANNAAPGTPTDGVAKSIIDGIEVSWKAPADDDLAGYRIFVSTDPAFTPNSTNMVGEVGFDTTSFLYITSTYAEHTFRVRAYDDFGFESPDLVIESEGPKSPFEIDATAPNIPSGLTAAITRDAQGVGSANVSWTFDALAAGQEDIQGFSIKWRKVGETFYNIELTDKTSRSVQIPLPNGYSDYEFQIASYDWAANYSDYSAVVTLNGAIPGPPPVLASITAAAGRDNLQVIWSESTADDVRFGGHYEVELDDNAGFSSPLQYSTANTSITVSGLLPTTTYYFRARAVDTTGATGTWVSGNAATLGFPTTPPSDGNAPASSPTPTVSGGIGYLFVNWTPVANNDAVTYEIHLSATTGFTPAAGTKVGEVSGTVMTIENLPGTTTPLSHATTYYVKTIAKDRDGAAAASAQGSAQIAKAASTDVSFTGRDLGVPTVFKQATQPASGMIRNDIWIDNDDNDRQYVYDGSAWVKDGKIDVALSTANGKNKSTYSTSAPGTTANTAGDIWFQRDVTTGRIIAQFEGTGGTAWTERKVDGLVIANLDAGQITTGQLAAERINTAAITIGQSQVTNLTTDLAGKTTMTAVDTAYSGTKTLVNSWKNSTDQTKIDGGFIYTHTVDANVLKTSTLDAAVITLGTGGQIKSSNYDGTGTSPGFSISENAIIIRNGTISAGVLESGSTITSNLSVTGTLTVSSSGAIKSSNYVANTTGYSLSTAGLDIRDGTISAKTLVAGTISSTGISVGAGGLLTVDSTGAIQSNNYSANSTGWRLSSTGLELNGGTVKASAIVGGTIGAQSITLGSGGSIQSSNGSWSISGTTFNFQTGTINAGTITAGQLKSSQPAVNASTGASLGAGTYAWFIDMQGDAQFGNAQVLGRLTVGSASYAASSGIQSYNYSAGSVGWKIDGNGDAFFNSATLRGSLLTSNGADYVSVDNSTGIKVNGYDETYGDTFQIILNPNDLVIGAGGMGQDNYIRMRMGSSTALAEIRAYLYGGMLLKTSGTGPSIWLNNYEGGNPAGMYLTQVYDITTHGSGVYFNLPSGKLRMTASSNMAGRIGTDSGTGASFAWQNGYIVLGGESYNLATPTAASVRELYCDRVVVTRANGTLSDRSQKKNITPITDATNIIKAITPSKFNLRGFEGTERDDIVDHGFIAQDVQEVLPEAVETRPDGNLGLNYQAVFSVGVAATKELIEKTESLEARILELEKLLAGS